MEFRWIALITLWTLIAGPVFDSPSIATNHQASSDAASTRPADAVKTSAER